MRDNDAGLLEMTQINLFLGYNGMKKIDAYDFKTYPISGFKADWFESVSQPPFQGWIVST